MYLYSWFFMFIFLSMAVFGMILWFGINNVAMSQMCNSDSSCEVAMSKLKDAMTYLMILTVFSLVGFSASIYAISNRVDVFGIEDEESEHGIAFGLMLSLFCMVFGILFFTSEACNDLKQQYHMFTWMPIIIIVVGSCALLGSTTVLINHFKADRSERNKNRRAEKQIRDHHRKQALAAELSQGGHGDEAGHGSQGGHDHRERAYGRGGGYN